MADSDLVELCRVRLGDLWSENESASAVDETVLPEALCARIRSAINSKTKTYRYVLPTQLLAKACRPQLDCRCLQSARGGSGAFDARTVAHRVVVPFDREYDSVLGGAPEPYVNNPLRVPEVSIAFRPQQKDKSGWDDLCVVLQSIQENPQWVQSALFYVLREIHSRLATVRIVYPAARRVSALSCQSVIDKFLSTRSGGVRLECVTAALFETLGRQFSMFESIRGSSVNSADSQSGLAADLECLDESGEISLAVEVKDHGLRLVHVQDKLPALREKQVAETLFVAPEIVAEDREAIKAAFQREFSSGHNLHWLSMEQLLTVLIPLFAERGRYALLVAIGRHLDDRADVEHRRAWAELLSGI